MLVGVPLFYELAKIDCLALMLQFLCFELD